MTSCFYSHQILPDVTKLKCNRFQSISAKADNGEPCCDWVGGGGSGHFVKMVHNGIEYGDMQLICEAYHLMKVSFFLSCPTRRWLSLLTGHTRHVA